jgi:hypothetical protein
MFRDAKEHADYNLQLQHVLLFHPHLLPILNFAFIAPESIQCKNSQNWTGECYF